MMVRAVFQMSGADSSSLLDNPAAAKLRQHRGLFASEDVGTLEIPAVWDSDGCVVN